MAAARPEFIRLANRIAGKSRPLRFTWNGQPTQFVFSNLHRSPRGSWRLQVRLGGHDLIMEINRLPELAWVSPELVGIDLHSLPNELACGLIESCLGEIFTALSKAGIDVAITGVEPFSFRDAPEEIIEWSIHRGGETGWMHGHVAGDDAALSHLASLVELAPVSPVVDESQIPMPVQLVAASTRLTLTELQSIEMHDVILADLTNYKVGNECTLFAAGTQVGLGRAEARIFSLKQLTPKPATTMGDPATASINDLDIELTFVVGQTTLTVSELRGLAPGFTFKLSTPVGQGITLCANGKAIGKGELIEVGNHLGVRVTEFSAS